MNIQDKRVVIGMDLDSALEAIPSTLARRVENCRVNIVNDGKDGIVEPFMGNAEVVNVLPAGTNKTIGSYSDTTKNRIYYFNWNSNNVDQIFYFDGTNFIKLVEGDLSWGENHDIHSITLINNMLSWTEGGEKYPRQIDVNKQYINPSEFDISFIKRPPTFPPIIGYESYGNKNESNFYTKNNYYFIYRFSYEDGQNSAWSPQSKLVSSLYDNKLKLKIPYTVFGMDGNRDFKAGGEVGLQYNTRIKYIDFAYANTYLGPFKQFKRVNVLDKTTLPEFIDISSVDSDISFRNNNDIFVEFRNDLATNVISTADTSRPYDEVWPSETITTADNRNIIGSTLEGFPVFEFVVGNVSQGFKSQDYFSPSGPQALQVNGRGIQRADYMGNYMVWKNNSKYEIGVVFYNEFGQKSGVYTDQQLRILTPADYRRPSMDSVWSFNFALGGTPPEWATHYQIVRTNNNKVTRFVQGVTNDIQYVAGYNENGDPVFLRKIIGLATQETRETQALYILGIGGVPGEKRVNNSQGATNSFEWNYPLPVYEYGQTWDNTPIVKRTTYWQAFGGGNFVQAGLNFATAKYQPTYNTTWLGKPDSAPITSDENDYIIGYNLDGPIYVGGVNRRGEKINEFVPNNLQQAVDIFIDIYNWNNTTTFEQNSLNGGGASGVQQLYNASNETPYVFQAGDRVNIYYSSVGDYVGILDIEIKDFVDGRYLKIKYDKRFLEGKILGAGAFIEIFTPNTGSDDIFFYEYGDCYPVINPKTSTRSYSKSEFSIFEGDTHYMVYSELYAKDVRVNFRAITEYEFRTGYGYYTYPFFSMTPDNLNRTGIWEKANGRPNVVLLDGERQTRRKNTIRFSDRYIDGATVNGTSTFYSFNSIQLDYDWGAIRKLTSQEEVILANCEQEAALIYVNKAMISNASGVDSLIISDRVLNSPKKLPGGWGCLNPESVTQYDQYIYFYSKQKRAALRYNVFNSVFDISGNYNARSYFYNKVSDRCYGGFDPKFRTQYFKFDDENIGFIDPANQDHPNTWGTFVSFLPEKFGYIQLDMYTFKDGKIYKHEVGPVNTFYGIKSPSRINMVFNIEPNMQKIANFISQETDKPLWCETVTNQDGQLTVIEDGAFERINKDWQSDVPGDTSTGLSKWEGDLMSSHLTNVNFRYDGDSLFRLRYLNLYSQISQRTNK